MLSYFPEFLKVIPQNLSLTAYHYTLSSPKKDVEAFFPVYELYIANLRNVSRRKSRFDLGGDKLCMFVFCDFVTIYCCEKRTSTWWGTVGRMAT